MDDGWEEAGLTVEESMFAAFRQTVSVDASFRVDVEGRRAVLAQRGARVTDEEIRRLLRNLELEETCLVGYGST
jgi:hypothetical protein